MPLPALHRCKKQAVIKMVKAEGLSLRGRFAPVAISGRHLQFVQGVDKYVQTDCVCSGVP